MYHMTVQVPYIDADTVEAISKVSPTLHLLLDVPRIDTSASAVVYATRKINELLRNQRQEFADEVTGVTLDNDKTTWSVAFIVCGD